MSSDSRLYKRCSASTRRGSWAVVVVCVAALSRALAVPRVVAFDATESVVARTDASAGPATYFISPSGNDANSGTSPSSPWRSTARVNQLALAPGSAVLFEAGTDHPAPGQLTVRSSGTAAAQIVVGSYGASGPARLHFNSTLESGILVHDSSGVAISNLTLLGSAPSAAAAVNSGILLWSDLPNASQALSGGVLIQDVQVSGFAAGITMDASGCGGFRGVVIQRALLYGNVIAGLQSYGAFTASCYSHSDLLVADVFALNNTGNASDTDSDSGSGIAISAVDGAFITRCLAAWNGAANGHMHGGPVGIWTWSSRNVTISSCVSAFNMAGGVASGTQSDYVDGGGFDLDGGTSDSVIEYSLSFGNAGPGYLICQFGGYDRATTNNAVRYSVSLNDTVTSGNGATGLNFYSPDASLLGFTALGNTFIGSSASQRPQTGLSDGSAPVLNITLASNAFFSLGSAPGATLSLPPMPALAANGNAYWPPLWQFDGVVYTSLPAFRAASGLEVASNGAPTGTAADPKATWAAAGGFFAGCIPWALQQDILALPALPNSPIWDAIRGFSGCK